jgi:hypothetical protein
MKSIILSLFVLISYETMAQSNLKDSTLKKDSIQKQDSSQKRDRYVVRIGVEIVDGDTMSVYLINRFVKSKETITQEEKDNYAKLVRYVKKALPYAKLAAFRLQMMEDNLNLLTTEKARKKYIKESEKAVKKQFMDDLKNFYVEEGKILLKLIHRETGKTTWDILKNYRGTFETLFWQAMAKTYDANMKVTYDPVIDYQIEEIIKSLEVDNVPKN